MYCCARKCRYLRVGRLLWRFLALGGVVGHLAENNALKRKYGGRFVFSRRRPLNRWRVAPVAGASAFSGVGGVFAW
nr:MAG TPA: hypothetical protein [Caudoviricetes sp.]